MSENRLSRLLAQLRLLARRNIQLGQDGRVVSGELDPELEALHLQVDELHDQLLDGHPLGELQIRFLTYCQEVVALNRGLIRQLELEFA